MQHLVRLVLQIELLSNVKPETLHVAHCLDEISIGFMSIIGSSPGVLTREKSCLDGMMLSPKRPDSSRTLTPRPRPSGERALGHALLQCSR